MINTSENYAPVYKKTVLISNYEAPQLPSRLRMCGCVCVCVCVRVCVWTPPQPPSLSVFAGELRACCQYFAL